MNEEVNFKDRDLHKIVEGLLGNDVDCWRYGVRDAKHRLVRVNGAKISDDGNLIVVKTLVGDIPCLGFKGVGKWGRAWSKELKSEGLLAYHQPNENPGVLVELEAPVIWADPSYRSEFPEVRFKLDSIKTRNSDSGIYFVDYHQEGCSKQHTIELNFGKKWLRDQDKGLPRLMTNLAYKFVHK